jgi:ATP-dependent DNA helicase RecQ
MPTPVELLQSVFGYESFRPMQSEIIESVLERRDTLAVLPTGAGKSLCYQIPALIFPRLTVVVSPLIALMKDQVEQLAGYGVPAVFLNSSLDFDGYRANAQRVRRGEAHLLFAAPEAVLNERMGLLMKEAGVDLIVIDEAHCISEWGHDFRREYRQLIELRRRFPQAVCLAMTATATQRVRQDIHTSLGFKNAGEFVASFNRPNLKLEVISKKKPDDQTLEFVRQYPGQSGIIYCFSRNQVDELSAFLNQQGISALPYHAGLGDSVRKANQEAFIHDDVQIIVATIAFGMGINKPNVRFILHYDLPKSIESYYQEIGRAGRDGLSAHCLLLYSYADRKKVEYFIDQKEPPEKDIAYQHLNALVSYARTTGCRRKPILSHFGEHLAEGNCGMCDNCLKRQVDLTIPAQKLVSCIIRSGERFGAEYVIDLLLGEESERVARYGHQNLSTYGIGKELTRREWRRLVNLLIDRDLLMRDSEFKSLKVTDAGREFIQERAVFTGQLDESTPAQPVPVPAVPALEGQPEPDAGLFELLRTWRKGQADQEHVPAYVIFLDRTLIELAIYRPQSLQSMEGIFGLSPLKLERYGKAMLAVIRPYCRKHGLAEIRRGKQNKHSAQTGKTASVRNEKTQATLQGKPRKYIRAGEMFIGGAALDEIANEFGVQPAIILDYLAQFIQAGNKVPEEQLDDLVLASRDRQERIFGLFDQLGSQYLKLVHDASGGEVDDDDLTILRLVYLNKNLPTRNKN